MAKIENILNSKKFKNLQNASIQGHPVKRECEVASTENIDLELAVTVIDGVSLIQGNRVLLKNQEDASENGIYSVIEGEGGLYLVRSIDFCLEPDLAGQPIVWVVGGNSNSNTSWMLLTIGEIVIGETDLIFVMLSDVSPVLAREYFLAGEYIENVYPKFSDWNLLKTDLYGRFPNVALERPVIVHRRFNLANGTLISLGADTKPALFELGIRVEDGEGMGGNIASDYTDVKSSRAISLGQPTYYENTSGKNLFVLLSVQISGLNEDCQIGIKIKKDDNEKLVALAGIIIEYMGEDITALHKVTTLSFIVPPGQSYAIVDITGNAGLALHTVMELTF